MDDEMREADFPPVVPGSKVIIQLKSGRHYKVNEAGERIGPDEFMSTPPVEMTVLDQDECYPENWAEMFDDREEAHHGMTICPECISSWAIDYYIELAQADGTNAN